jgi:hypothetical protein
MIKPTEFGSKRSSHSTPVLFGDKERMRGEGWNYWNGEA